MKVDQHIKNTLFSFKCAINVKVDKKMFTIDEGGLYLLLVPCLPKKLDLKREKYNALEEYSSHGGVLDNLYIAPSTTAIPQVSLAFHN